MRASPSTRPLTFDPALAWVAKTVESALNWVFSLSHTAGVYRNSLRYFGLFLLYGFWVATLYDLQGWLALGQGVTTVLNDNPSMLPQTMIALIGNTFLHPIVLRHLLAVIAPYMLVHSFAAIYLADIFEKEVNVAGKFLNEAAFAQGYQTIRIRAGRLVDSDYDSPIVQIGGPGYVTVELDSAAVFEGPEGSLRVIGPTVNLRYGRAVINDFERLRQCIDLRDIIGKQEVTSRSKDGILIKARDIQYYYSVYRGENPKKSLTLPYPYDEQAIKDMIKGVVVPVSTSSQPQKTPEWTRPLPSGLFVSINIEFANFITQRGLSEFFSSIGSPEEEALSQRAAKIHNQAHELAGQDGYNMGESPLKAGEFEYRPRLAEKLFGSAQFKNFMRGKGVQVNWIGVGIWETPSEIILENHLKAWKISMENMRLGGSEQLKQLYDNSRNSTLIQKINQLPINIYYLLSEKEKKNDDEIVDGLFKEYHAYLQGISRYYADHQQKIPGNINAALEAIGYLMYHEISADYYPCYKLNSRADLNIQGALIYTIDVAFSARPLPGYTLFPPVLFDFANNPELTFVISARAFDASLEPATPQRKTMKQNDLYLSAQFQAVVLPGTSTDVRINIEQGNQTLTSLLVPLNA